MAIGRAQPAGEARAKLVFARGPAAVERALLDALAQHRAAARRDPALLARPVRVVLPSRSLRLHLSATIARELGTSAGFELQTLHALALEILALDEDGPRAKGLLGEAFVELLTRRHARASSLFATELGAFEEGFEPVVAAVRDLFDSGFEPALADALLELLATLRASRAEKTRCEELVRVAGRVAQDLERAGGGGRSELLRRARDVFERDPGRLAARALYVHGFADVTGRAAELLESLARRFPGAVLLDRPPDPWSSAAPASASSPEVSTGAGARFVERLAARLQSALGAEQEAPGAAPDAPAPAFARRLLSAPGLEAEAREVARRVRELLDSGATPERIGIVARDLGPYRATLRAQLSALGVPFSALRARAPLDGPGRALAALADVLRRSGDVSTERWLDAVGAFRIERAGRGRAHRTPSADVRLALRVLGATRLADVAEIDPETKDDLFALPVRSRVQPGAEDASSARRGFSAWRRKLEGAELFAVRAAARALAARFERWPERAPFAEHAALFAELRRRDLGWRARHASELRARSAIGALAEALGAEPLERAEFLVLASRALRSAAAPALDAPFEWTRDGEAPGPAAESPGAGVPVLDAMEARGRTFEHLFVIGLSRDVFPRVVREDPLLSDGARRALESLLPDIPVKARGRDEDRYLFAQLCAASPSLTLSWPECDDDGRRLSVSPFVEAFLAASDEDGARVESAPPLHPERDDAPRPRTAAEHAILAGLRSERGRARLLELALRERGVAGAASIARARAAVLAAYEEGPFAPRRLAPWLGFLGAQEAVGVRPDPRSEPPPITRIEALARCPWQAVLTRMLRLDEGFESLDGSARIEPRSIGNVVHSVLEKIARAALQGAGPQGAGSLGTPPEIPAESSGRTLEAVLAREPLHAPWPAPELFEAWLLQSARAALRSAHAPAGLVRWLAERARPHLDTARELLGREAELGGGVLGVEVEGRASVPTASGEPCTVTFRADRVERVGEELVLTDFKTGKPVTKKALLAEGIPRGTNLQPLVYVLGARGVAPDARGRYLFLTREDEGEPSVGVGAQHADAERDLGDVLRTVQEAWLAGTFFPRLFDEEKDREPDACRMCSVSQACLRGDSGARQALLDWTSRPLEGSGPEATLRALWQLAARKSEVRP